MLEESSEKQFGRPKKKVNIFENFLKIRPPPGENPRSAPDCNVDGGGNFKIFECYLACCALVDLG